MLTVHGVVWEGYPGAVTRVTLPLAFGFNVLLAREAGRQFWPWFVLGNLHLFPAALMLRLSRGTGAFTPVSGQKTGRTGVLASGLGPDHKGA